MSKSKLANDNQESKQVNCKLICARNNASSQATIVFSCKIWKSVLHAKGKSKRTVCKATYLKDYNQKAHSNGHDTE